MKKLYLFNPENDMALAYGGPYYMPPANARKMAADLSSLPLWYAPAHSDVWLADARQAEWMKSECPLPLAAEGVTRVRPLYNKVCPWGWSAAVVYRLKGQGIGEEVLPTPERMERIRTLSARGTAVQMLEERDLPHTIGEAWRAHTLQEVLLRTGRGGKFLLKAPWSGSGRGIQRIEGEVSEPMQGWINHILKTQGYVVVEPFYDKVADFAMEFLSTGGGVSFAGYSLFETDAHGIYKENLLASDTEIEARLSVHVPVEWLAEVRRRLEERLAEVIGYAYEGYLGVDMMLCRMAEGCAVHPCVEINLRMNMGITSRLLHDRYVHPASVGRFVIEFYPREGEALLAHEALQRAHPLTLEEGRIRQGYLSLTPVFRDTSYQAYVVVS